MSKWSRWWEDVEDPLGVSVLFIGRDLDGNPRIRKNARRVFSEFRDDGVSAAWCDGRLRAAVGRSRPWVGIFVDPESSELRARVGEFIYLDHFVGFPVVPLISTEPDFRTRLREIVQWTTQQLPF